LITACAVVSTLACDLCLEKWLDVGYPSLFPDWLSLVAQSGLVPADWRNYCVYLQDVFTLRLGQIYNNFKILKVYSNTQNAQSGLVPADWRNYSVYLQDVFTLRLGQIYNNFRILQVYNYTQIAQSGLVPTVWRNYDVCLQDVFTLRLGQIYNNFRILQVYNNAPNEIESKSFAVSQTQPNMQGT
jgi:hypothetical protein